MYIIFIRTAFFVKACSEAFNGYWGSLHYYSVEKDVGPIPSGSNNLTGSLQSQEQVLLRKIREVVGDGPVSEAKLQFAPQWIIDKSIQAEKENYTSKKVYISVHRKDVPPRSNTISSHHFFQVKTDGTPDKLKLKCRLVPHGNRDAEKDSVRTDSATAQFPVIRILLSLATILRLKISAIDIRGAYLQAGELKRDIYMKPPRGWESFVGEIWKLIKPAYGLVESGRLWQLCVEDWLFSYGFECIPGLPQLFVLRNEKKEIKLLVAKVVDDHLVAGNMEDIFSFHAAFAKRFEIGRFVHSTPLTFNRLLIDQEKDYSISVSMSEYFGSIQSIALSRQRRKQSDEACTAEEKTSLLELAGKLNFLGHGVLPSAALVASKMQQDIGNLRVKHLAQANCSSTPSPEAQSYALLSFSFERRWQVLLPSFL